MEKRLVCCREWFGCWVPVNLIEFCENENESVVCCVLCVVCCVSCSWERSCAASKWVGRSAPSSRCSPPDEPMSRWASHAAGYSILSQILLPFAASLTDTRIPQVLVLSNFSQSLVYSTRRASFSPHFYFSFDRFLQYFSFFNHHHHALALSFPFDRILFNQPFSFYL